MTVAAAEGALQCAREEHIVRKAEKDTGSRRDG